MAESSHSMSDWDSPDVQTWMEEAEAHQQHMYLRLGDREWDKWDKSDTTILLRKVGFAMFSQPGNLPEKNNNFTGYGQTQLEEIKRVADTILERAEDDSIINFACIFVFGNIGEKRFKIPVFKVKGTQNQTLFVDLNCCVYENWRDYLYSNCLPKCMYCYPLDGLYHGNEGQVLVDFGTSSGDSTATPISVDHYFYSQSINLNDLEETTDWLEIVDNVLEMAHDSMSASITRASADDEIAPAALIIACNVIAMGRLTVNGLETLNAFISIVEKANEGTLIPLEVFNFSSSVLFFSNNLFLENSAEGIIEKTQEVVQNSHCHILTSLQIEDLLTLSDQVQGKVLTHENFNKFKLINHIGDKQTFYESLVTARDYFAGHQIKFSVKEPGLININDELHIAPNKLVQIVEEDFLKILGATRKVNDGDMNDAKYWKTIETILRNNRLKMEYQRQKAIEQLKQAFNTNNLEMVKIGDVKIFENMTPSELDRLTDVMEASGKNYNQEIIEIANEFAKRRGCNTPRDYCNYVEFTAKYLSDLKSQKEDDFQAALTEAKGLGEVNLRQFALQYGVIGKRGEHFNKQVYENFLTNREECFNALENLYIELEGTVLPLNESIDPKFTDISAVCHYFKHNKFGQKELTPEEYFKIPIQTLNEPLYIKNRKEQLNQQGDRNMITFTNPSQGAVCIVYEKLEDGTQSLASVHYDRKLLNQ